VIRAASRFLSNLELRVTDLLKDIFFCHSFMILAPAQGNSEYFELNVYLKRMLHDA